MKKIKDLLPEEVDRIVEMGWEDRTTFDAIFEQFGVSEKQTIKIMRKQMKPSSFNMWRKRVQGRKTKHEALRQDEVKRFKSSRQKTISLNKFK